MTSILVLIVNLLQILNALVFFWCILTWFPNIKWYEQPFKTLDQVVQPIITPFRKIIPPIGNIDISAMVAIIVLQLLTAGVAQLIGSF